MRRYASEDVTLGVADKNRENNPMQSRNGGSRYCPWLASIA
jgi:hypothetical protein